MTNLHNHIHKPIYVIADLHLSRQEPAITAGFLRFLTEEAPKANALYILGDLFDAWIGDDDPDPFKAEIADALRQFSALNIPCYFMGGNRDFLLGKRYAKQANLRLIKESTFLLEAFNKRILLLHGDTLCTDDHRYQKYRKFVHSPLIQAIFRVLPLKFRLLFGQTLRANSERENQQKSKEIMDVNQQAVYQITQQNKVDWLVHGHTHRPAIHQYQLVDPQSGMATQHLRAVSGAWHETGWFICIADTLTLHQYPLSK